jgi:hypothetical protein
MGLVTDEVEGVVQQVGESDCFLLQRSVGVPEDHGDVDVPGTEQLQALDRVGIDEVPTRFPGATGTARRPPSARGC